VSEHSARKFAQVVFEQHCHEGEFTIDVTDLDLQMVKKALEDLGCLVEAETFRPRLTVSCPDGVRSA
jgi:hypothetical protein